MKRILVALDASPRAPSVLAAAAHLAELTNTTLVLYRAVGVPPDLPKEIFKMTDRSVEEVLMNNALADLERLAKDIRKHTSRRSPRRSRRHGTASAAPRASTS